MDNTVNEKLKTLSKGEFTMTEFNTDTQATPQTPSPNPDLKSLDVLVGTWKVSGEAQGFVTYKWLEGGFFLLQEVDLFHSGHEIKGIEIIGHEQEFGAEPSEDIKSRFYDFIGGMTLDYVYEILVGKDGKKTLMIWGGEKGSPAYYKGEFSDDGNTCVGDWVYPGGGGYYSSMTRVTG
jgi:hypothetical protein